MARDHFLPAAFLGRFSSDSTAHMRERRVWVYRSRQRSVVRQKAEKVGYINRYYRLSRLEHARLVEDTWTEYEKRLTSALDELVDPAVNSVDGRLWVRVLVPFVAGIFVRSPDFVRKYEGPKKDDLFDDPLLQADNTNMSRIMAMTRSLAPIMAANWTVAHITGSEPLLTNDLGYVNNSFAFDRTVGWTIPIGPRCALQLAPCPDGRSRRIMFHSGDEGGWRAFIDHVWLQPNNHVGLNAAMSKIAHEFLVGSTRESVERHAGYMGQDAEAGYTFNPQMWTSHRMQIVHEFEWYRLVRSLQYSPEDNIIDRFALDFAVQDADWSPPIVMVPTNLPEFQTGLRLRGRSIELAMSEVPGFTDYSPGPFRGKAKA
jgi:hypothetical protein